MNTLERYILKAYLTAFALTGIVLTFVLSIGFLFKVLQFLSKGVSVALVMRYLLASMPEVLGFTLPLALLISALLVFGRMSTDSEISAMKACGVSFLTIMRGPVIIAVILTLVGFYLQNYAMPNGHYVRRSVGNQLAIEAGVQLMEPGRFIDEIDNLAVFCNRKVDHKDAQGHGYTTLYDLLAIDRRDGFLREIHADEADLRAEGNDLVFTLRNAIISPPEKGVKGSVMMKEFNYICRNVVSRAKKYNKKPADYTLPELWHEMVQAAAVTDLSAKAARQWQTKLRYIFCHRMVWSLSAICFVLVGIPLGCQSQRKESSRGMIYGVSFGIAFFLFIMLAQSFSNKPATYPYVIVWIPVIICIGVISYIIPKNQ